MQKIKVKTNKSLRKVECWKCGAFFRKVVLTKYRGVLCKKCYREEYEEAKSIFFDFIASFEVEYDADFEEDLKTLEDFVEMIRDYYEGGRYRLENEEPKEEYKEIVQTAKEIYETLEKKRIKSILCYGFYETDILYNCLSDIDIIYCWICLEPPMISWILEIFI